MVAAHKRVHAHDGLELRTALGAVLVVGLDPLNKLKGAHHVAEVSQRHRGLAVGRDALNQFRNLCRRLQHAELAVHVEVKKRRIRGCARRLGGRGRNRFCSLGLEGCAGGLEVAVREANGRNHLRVGRDKVFELSRLYAKLTRLPMADAHQFPKAACGSLYVRSGIVGLGKLLTKELGVQFSQFRGLESASPRNPHQRRSLRRHRIQDGLLNPGFIPAEPQVLGSEHIQVKLEVVPHHKLRPVERRLKGSQGLRNRNPVLASQFGTDSVNLLSPKRNVKSLGLNQKVRGLK